MNSSRSRWSTKRRAMAPASQTGPDASMLVGSDGRAIPRRRVLVGLQELLEERSVVDQTLTQVLGRDDGDGRSGRRVRVFIHPDGDVMRGPVVLHDVRV